MAGTDELMARLAQLEQGYYGDKEAARQKQFMDTYGGRFSNNHGLGMAILNELDARGVDTSAADEAVQEILDQLRTECTEILDMLKDVQDAAVQNQEKIDTIADAVQNQVAENPDASVSAEPNLEITSPEEVPALEEPAAEQQFTEQLNFKGGEPPAEPPVETPAPTEPPAEEVPPEEVQPEPPAEEIPPTEAVSDIRKKRIERMKANWGKTRPMKEKEKQKQKQSNSSDSFKPPAEMLEAAMRGY